MKLSVDQGCFAMEQEHDRIKTELEQYRASDYRYFKFRVGI